MIDVDKEVVLYSLEKFQRYPYDILIIRHGTDTIGNIDLKYADEKFWIKAIDHLNKLKNGQAS